MIKYNQVFSEGGFVVMFNTRPNSYNPYKVQQGGKTVFSASCLGVCLDYISDNLPKTA